MLYTPSLKLMKMRQGAGADKYICQFREIHFSQADEQGTVADKYIVQFGQIHLSQVDEQGAGVAHRNPLSPKKASCRERKHK